MEPFLMRKGILIQARLSSRRLPGKMLMPLNGIPLIEYVYKRCLNTRSKVPVAVLTSMDVSDDTLANYCQKQGFKVFRGDLDNVLSRYVAAAEHYGLDVICRVCGDSPFVDVELIDKMFDILEAERLDFIAPSKNSCVSGLDSEVVTLQVLKRVLDAAQAKDDLEHVTFYIRNNMDKFKAELKDVTLKPDSPKYLALTVDYDKDMLLCDKIAGMLGGRYDFKSEDIFEIIEQNEELQRMILFPQSGIANE
jgi:spore coat polysaccharide biosynthesis protein SpsF (cytidylyltransferase family)